MLEGFVAAIEAETPSLAALSPHLYVRFHVRHFRSPQIVWLNDRWFIEMGVNSTEPAVRSAIEACLLQHFAVAVPDSKDPEDAYVGDWLPMQADRYGGIRGSVHGGSGRVGTRGHFNAKGIGRTPLVSDRSDWYHSHGCMWLEEAIREAILAEVADREFPHGAAPTIAIIDTGTRIHWGDGNTGERRAIIVRPNFLRLASLQRSIFFGDSGHADADQVIDARRTRDMWTNLWPDDRSASDGLVEAFGRLGEQYGFGHCTRFWPGPFFSSNLALDGRLVDFGATRSVLSWQRAEPPNPVHGVGAEAKLVSNAAKFMCATGNKYGRSVPPISLTQAFASGQSKGFDHGLARSGIAPDSVTAEALREFYRQQQRSAVAIDASPLETDWLKVQCDEPAQLALAHRTIYSSANRDGVLNALTEFVEPREQLRRENLSSAIEALIQDMENQSRISPHRVSEFIKSTLRASHRPWQKVQMH